MTANEVRDLLPKSKQALVQAVQTLGVDWVTFRRHKFIYQTIWRMGLSARRNRTLRGGCSVAEFESVPYSLLDDLWGGAGK